MFLCSEDLLQCNFFFSLFQQCFFFIFSTCSCSCSLFFASFSRAGTSFCTVFFSQLLQPLHFWLTLDSRAVFFRKCINLGFFICSILVLRVCTSWDAFSFSQESFSASLSCLSVSLKSCLFFLISSLSEILLLVQGFLNLFVKLLRRTLASSFLKIGVSPPFGPNETIFVLLPGFLPKPVGPNLLFQSVLVCHLY